MNPFEPQTQGTTMKRLTATLTAAFLAIGFAATAGAFSYQGALADSSG